MKTYVAIFLIIIAVTTVIFWKDTRRLISDACSYKTNKLLILSRTFYENGIKIGYPKSNIPSSIRPDNIDDKYVWAWIGSRDVPENKSWKELLDERGGLFVIFNHEGQVVTPLLKCVEITPFDAFKEYVTDDRKVMEQCLGKEPLSVYIRSKN